MKILVLGVQRLTGVGRESKKPYDFARVLVGNAIREGGNVKGTGFEQAEIELRLGCEGEFAGITFPAVLELKTDNEMGRNGRMQVVCTGVVRAAAVRQAG